MRVCFWKKKSKTKPVAQGYCRLSSWREDARLESEIEEHRLIENGLLDPGQPTQAAHARHIERMEAPFSTAERRMIRSILLTTLSEEELF